MQLEEFKNKLLNHEKDLKRFQIEANEIKEKTDEIVGIIEENKEFEDVEEINIIMDRLNILCEDISDMF